MSRYPNSLELMQACHTLAKGSATGLSERAELVRSCLSTMRAKTDGDHVATEEKADALYNRLRVHDRTDWAAVLQDLSGLQMAPLAEQPAEAKEEAKATP